MKTNITAEETVSFTDVDTMRELTENVLDKFVEQWGEDVIILDFSVSWQSDINKYRVEIEGERIIE